jgi:hypothetical protein
MLLIASKSDIWRVDTLFKPKHMNYISGFLVSMPYFQACCTSLWSTQFIIIILFYLFIWDKRLSKPVPKHRRQFRFPRTRRSDVEIICVQNRRVIACNANRVPNLLTMYLSIALTLSRASSTRWIIQIVCIYVFGWALPLPHLFHYLVFMFTHAWELFLVGNQCVIILGSLEPFVQFVLTFIIFWINWWS